MWLAQQCCHACLSASLSTLAASPAEPQQLSSSQCLLLHPLPSRTGSIALRQFHASHLRFSFSQTLPPDTQVGYLLTRLLAEHPGMSVPVVREVERFMFR